MDWNVSRISIPVFDIIESKDFYDFILDVSDHNLNKFETEICAGLFPPIAKKGYSLINNKYFPSNPNIT